jgi:hypothetical protein
MSTSKRKKMTKRQLAYLKPRQWYKTGDIIKDDNCTMKVLRAECVGTNESNYEILYSGLELDRDGVSEEIQEGYKINQKNIWWYLEIMGIRTEEQIIAEDNKLRELYGRPLTSVKNEEGKWEAKPIEGNSMT